MKFSCLQENLKQGLSIVSHLTTKNINFPILNNVLIKIEDKLIKLITTNLEVAINVNIRGKAEKDGDFTVPAKLFYDYVALLPPNERVDLEVKGSLIEIKSGSYDTKIKGQPATEFPLLPQLKKELTYAVRGRDFKKALEQVLFSVASNEIRPEISGVLFNFGKSEPYELTVVGTDSYRLSEKKLPFTLKNDALADNSHKNFIVPLKTLIEVNHILSVFSAAGDDALEISVLENQVLFSYDSVELIAKLIEGQYPNYQQVIPETFQTKGIFNKDELAKTIKATSLFATGLNDVYLKVSPPEGIITVSSVNSQTGEQKADVKGEIQGIPNEVTVNYKYLLDFFNSIDATEVEFKMIDAFNPCVLIPKDSKDFLYVVMPIKR